MDKDRFDRIVTGLDKQGIKVVSNCDIDRYLNAMGAEAAVSSDGKYIYIQHDRIPTASAMFEEIIHSTQIRKQGPIESIVAGCNVEFLRREIEAQKKMLRNSKAYGFTDDDIADVKRNLSIYMRELEKGGFVE